MSTEAKLTQYYRIHSKIYDLTRWTFLFGRNALLRKLKPANDALNILEVGCGTGHNLNKLCRIYPNAQITGVDLSQDMIQVAQKKLQRYTDRVRLVNSPLHALNDDNRYDLIVFSYTLSMINPDPESAISKAQDYLRHDGIIAVVDFRHSGAEWFKRWMWMNHVRMDNHLGGLLSKYFLQDQFNNKQAYGGLWTYFFFIGKKI